MSNNPNIVRNIESYAFNPQWMSKQMVFIAGPRQIGKTWTAKKILSKRKCEDFYYNFDTEEIRQKFNESASFFESDVRLAAQNSKKSRPVIVIDEIHKRTKWKNELKGLYDKNFDYTDIVVTGSARLDVLTSSGESLAGRYLLYRLLPIGIQELASVPQLSLPPLDTEKLFEDLMSTKPQVDAHQTLLELGGYPDPLVIGSKEYRNRWANDYRRLIIREDLRDLSRIMEIDKVEKLWRLLPEKVMSPLSIESIRGPLQASHEAVRTWLMNLEKLYSIFTIKPWAKKISRAISKETKIYLMDWALHQDDAKRFENYVMSSLVRACTIWTDQGFGDFEVRYVRNREKKEADFLIIKDGKPLIIGDSKLGDEKIDLHIKKMSSDLGNIPIIQIVNKSRVLKREGKNGLVISANQIFSRLP